MLKSATTWFLDFARHLLIISGTVTVLYFSRTRVHWPLTIILAIPIYAVMFYLVGFLTSPLYLLTPEYRAVSIVLKAIGEDDFSTALRAMGVDEKRHVVELQGSPHAGVAEGNKGQDEFAVDLDDRSIQDGSDRWCDDKVEQMELIGSTPVRHL